MACIYHHDASAKGIGHLQMERIKGFPVSEKGIEKGVSACFAGIVDDYLLMFLPLMAARRNSIRGFTLLK